MKCENVVRMMLSTSGVEIRRRKEITSFVRLFNTRRGWIKVWQSEKSSRIKSKKYIFSYS